MSLPITRKIDFLASLVGTFCLAFAYYLELSVGLKPCPLCIVQRYIFLIIIVQFLLGGLLPLHNTWRRAYHFPILLMTAVGMIVAARHTWLQLQPPGQAPSCEASLGTLMQYLPLREAIAMLFQGGGDCSKIDWTFLYLSPAGWSLTFFTIFSLVALWQIFYKNPTPKKN